MGRKILNRDTTDYKQIAYKLQDDLEHQKWEQAHVDLPFLKEIKDRLIEGEECVAQKEFAMQMIGDWIDELEEILSK